MNKDFITFELALELKQLGFNEPCFAEYFLRDNETPFLMIGEYEILEAKNAGDDMAFACNCPTYSQAFRWFREKHDMSHSIDKDWDNGHLLGYEYMISEQEGVTGSKTYPTYEEAELACLKKLIEIVKEKQ